MIFSGLEIKMFWAIVLLNLSSGQEIGHFLKLRFAWLG